MSPKSEGDVPGFANVFATLCVLGPCVDTT
jgi:hypothetical protein